MAKQFVIGIDLGTTNSALAYAPLASVADPHELPGANLFSISQVVNPGEVREEPLLPSFLYLPAAVDFPEGSLELPWDGGGKFVVGYLAQKRGVENPSRLVSSA
jgi:molecular chaperone DnaK (HSP70)